MVPIKPYLLRAAWQWALDGGHTPHLLVRATLPGVVVPVDFIEDGRIVLNIHPDATSQLDLGDDSINFSARFSGRPFAVHIPLAAVLGLYAREIGEGISFPAEELSSDDRDDLPGDPGKKSPHGKPDLKLIK